MWTVLQGFIEEKQLSALLEKHAGRQPVPLAQELHPKQQITYISSYSDDN